jgi:hypothetical protein
MTTLALPSLADGVRLAPAALEALRADHRRIVVVGAGGWIGRALLAGLHDALGEAAGERIACFGSAAREVGIGAGRTVPQHPLARLAQLPHRPSLLFHLAFLTKDKVAAMAQGEFRSANRALSHQVFDALEPIGVDRLFLASSGAAAFADDDDAAPAVREDEPPAAGQRARHLAAEHQPGEDDQGQAEQPDHRRRRARGAHTELVEPENCGRHHTQHSAAAHAIHPRVLDHPHDEFTEGGRMGCCHESSSMVVGIGRHENGVIPPKGGTAYFALPRW